jgi:hypothetical protein
MSRQQASMNSLGQLSGSSKASLLLAFLVLLTLSMQSDAAQGIGHLKVPRVQRTTNASTADQISVAPHSYRTEYFSQTLDHFTFRPEGSTTFQQRYLINDDHWLREGHGPIFL